MTRPEILKRSTLVKLAISGLIAGALSVSAGTSKPMKGDKKGLAQFTEECEKAGAKVESHDCKGHNDCKGDSFIMGKGKLSHDCKGHSECKGSECVMPKEKGNDTANGEMGMKEESTDTKKTEKMEVSYDASMGTDKKALAAFKKKCAAEGKKVKDHSCHAKNDCKGMSFQMGKGFYNHDCKAMSICGGASCIDA